jgi:hypothetical protein
MKSIIVKKAKVAIGEKEQDAALIYREDSLIAVLSYDIVLGQWCSEAVFGRFHLLTTPETFDTVEAAADWFAQKFGSGSDSI